jgi:hypothetical protein
LMMATTSFMAVPRFLRMGQSVTRAIWHLSGQMAQESCKVLGGAVGACL